ncbi:MAG: hypothetical protein QT10_C0001G0179 [archaeon GW2011_AR19]|nr:MAG: hypothetical protein QT10_C0001G0179 [archaeon GW2011_AR19]
MQKRGLIIFSLIFLISFVLLASVFAQDTTNTNVVENNLPVEVPENTLASSVGYVSPEGGEVDLTEDEEVNVLVKEAEGFTEELSVKAGITPDSGAYFIEDKILAPFRDDSVNRERKIAEMQEMMQKGDIEAARKSFERYQRYADDFEREVSPEERAEALRSSQAIRGVAIREIAQNMPAGEKDEFVREIVLGEKDIETAAEIASKISELCSQLSKLDPSQYEKVCRIEGDAPDWRKKLDKDLTEEQRAEALKFGEIMSQCFETAGQNCKCEEISYPDFAEACSIAAPLATACEIENNEDACEQLDDLEMPELPDYLQDIMDELEGGMSESKYGMFLPPECEDAGAKSPKDCAKIMINTHAPEECRPALLAANVQNERQGREICEKIMFEQNAPPECVEAGITNSGECGKYMFKVNAPQECIDAGMDGSSKTDPMACRKFMESQFSGEGQGGCAPGTVCVPGSQWAPGTGPNMRNSGGDCKSISDPMKRLECYEGATQYVQGYRNDFQENFNKIDRPQFDVNRPQEFEQRYEERFRQDYQQPYQQGDFQGGQFQPPQQFQQPQDYQQQYPQPGTYQQPPQDYQQPTTTTTEPATTTTDSGTSSSDGGSEGGSITGGVISNSGFLRYWFFG